MWEEYKMNKQSESVAVLDWREELGRWKQTMEEGNTAYAKRRLSQAEVLFVNAMKQSERWPPVDDENLQQELTTALSKSLNNVAALYHAQGKYPMAEDIYVRALALKEKLHGRENADYALNLQNLAGCLAARGKYAESEQHFVQALAIRERLVGEDHPDLVTTLENFALLLKKMGNEQGASDLRHRASKLADRGSPVVWLDKKAAT